VTVAVRFGASVCAAGASFLGCSCFFVSFTAPAAGT